MGCVCVALCRYFPKIFGPDEDEPLNQPATMEAFQRLTEQVNHFLSEQEVETGSSSLMTSQEVAMGFVKVANEAMCRPIRALTQVGNTCPTHTGLDTLIPSGQRL